MSFGFPAARSVHRPGSWLIILTTLASIALTAEGSWRRAAATCDTSQVLTSPILISTGTYPMASVAGDFNGDGIMDLATACLYGAAGSGVVSIALGVPSAPGTVSFSTVGNFITNGAAANLVTGDFDEDGVLDLAVADLEGRVAVLIGTASGGHGDGNFRLPYTYEVGALARGIAKGDFNSDGILDLAVATEGGMAILLGRGAGGVGDGTFLDRVIYGHVAWGVKTGDFNGDGITDLAYSDAASNDAGVLFGMGAGGVGNGAFSAGPFMSAGAGRDVAVADFNADGALDFVTSSGNNGVRLFTNTLSGGVGTGVFTMSTLAGGRSINGVAVADFDGDGYADIAATDAGTYNVIILYNRSPGFSIPVSFPTGAGPIGITATPLYGDAIVDVVVTASSDNKINVYAGKCVAAPPPPPPPPPSTYDGRPHIAFVRDVPADQGGHVFLAWSRASADSVGAFVITGYRIWRRVPLSVGASNATASLGLVERRQFASVPGYWEPIATLPAQKFDGYAYTATTPQDSIEGSNPWIAFLVTALTANPSVFHDSPVDSGYSVDNLSPAILQQATAIFGNGYVALHWAPGLEADLAGYRIYRGASTSFIPGPSNLIASKPDTGFVDATTSSAYYKIAAVDIHGNLSRFVLLGPDAPTAALATFVGAEVTADHVALRWFTPSGGGVAATVARRPIGGGWSDLGVIVSDGLGNLAFEDRDVSPGDRYLYRLGIMDAGEIQFVGEILIEVPRPTFALLGARPNPVVDGRLSVSFSLTTAHRSQLELLDIAGRVRRSIEVGALGAGNHLVDLSPGSRVVPGVYFIRLVQDGRRLIQRVTILR
jgi:hypothetical protein